MPYQGIHRRPSGFFLALAGVVKSPFAGILGNRLQCFGPGLRNIAQTDPFQRQFARQPHRRLAEQGAVHHACRQVASLFGRMLFVLQIKLDLRMASGAILPGDAYGCQGCLLLPGELQISIPQGLLFPFVGDVGSAFPSPCQEQHGSAVFRPNLRAQFFSELQSPFRRNDRRGALILKDDEIPGIPR